MDSIEIAKKVIEYSKKKGADHASAILREETSSTLRFAKNNPTHHRIYEDISLTLAVSAGNKESIINTNILDNKNLELLAENAIENAKVSPVNPEFFEPVSPQEYIDTKTWFESTSRLSIEERGEIVRDICETAEKSNMNAFGNLLLSQGRIIVSNSKNLLAEQPYTDILLNLNCRTKNNNGSSQAYHGEADWNKLDHLNITEELIDIAKRSADPIYLEPGHYTVIMSPRAFSEYLVFLIWAMDARESDNGLSFFGRESKNSRLHDQCFNPHITIRSMVDHPDIPVIRFGSGYGSGGTSAGSIFSMGLPNKNITWIEKGKIMDLRYSPYYAKAKNKDPIAYPLNIIMSGGNDSLEGLISQTDKGILIESLHYVNPTNWSEMELTGLTRDGTFLIENGKIKGSVNNFRFNDSPVRSLNNIAGMTKSIKVTNEYFKGLIPYIMISDFHFSGISNAV